MIKAILFDFDGTLADTAPGIVNTLSETLRRMGAEVPSDDAMRQTIGLPLVKALQQLGNLSDKKADEAKCLYCDLFLAYEIPCIELFPKVIETLKELRDNGIRMAIVTSRDKSSLDLILERYGITDYFEQKITNSDNLTPKPAPDMVLALLDRMNLNADETLVVGDTTYDIDMGNRAHCQTCAVTYGNHTRKQLTSSKPTYIIDNFESIKTL